MYNTYSKHTGSKHMVQDKISEPIDLTNKYMCVFFDLAVNL